MTLDAVITGIGVCGFLFLYSAFSISSERMIEKSFLYFLGLIQTLVIFFIILSESLEVGSAIDYLAGFNERYFVFMVISFIAIVTVFMLHMVEVQLRNLKGDKDGEK
jgi:hypothetical protein